MYFVPIMKKVHTGQIVEFYSNSCLVKTKFGEFSCLAIKNVVVGDFVELEIIQDSKKLNGKILSIQERKTKLSKSDGNRTKLFAANSLLLSPSILESLVCLSRIFRILPLRALLSWIISNST